MNKLAVFALVLFAVWAPQAHAQEETCPKCAILSIQAVLDETEALLAATDFIAAKQLVFDASLCEENTGRRFILYRLARDIGLIRNLPAEEQPGAAEVLRMQIEVLRTVDSLDLLLIDVAGKYCGLTAPPVEPPPVLPPAPGCPLAEGPFYEELLRLAADLEAHLDFAAVASQLDALDACTQPRTLSRLATHLRIRVNLPIGAKPLVAGPVASTLRLLVSLRAYARQP